MRRLFFLCLALSVLSLAVGASAYAQESTPHSRVDTFDLLTEYSNNSSHILLGEARHRKLATFGIGYSRRVLLRRSIDLQYRAEFRPVVFESDPVVDETQAFIPNSNAPPGLGPSTFQYSFRKASPCQAMTVTTPVGNGQGVVIGTSTITDRCGRRIWTYGQALSPAGVKLNLLPHRGIQPFITAMGGTLLTSQVIPTDQAGSFNFVFSLGGGVEIFHGETTSTSRFAGRSLRFEFRVQHISNKNSATQNAGIDGGVVQVAYAFGR